MSLNPKTVSIYRKYSSDVFEIMLDLKNKEEEYLFGGARIAEGFKKELMEKGCSISTITYLYRCLEFLYKCGQIDRYTPNDLLDLCEKECNYTRIKIVRSCFNKRNCGRKIIRLV
jgi:hypothetical protein